MDQSDASRRLMMACLADRSRFRLVRALADGARCGTELAGAIGLSQSCTARHLQALQSAGVVTGERAGKRVMFRLRSDLGPVRELVEWALATGGPAPRGTGRDADSALVPAPPDGPEDEPGPRPVIRRPGDLEDFLL